MYAECTQAVGLKFALQLELERLSQVAEPSKAFTIGSVTQGVARFFLVQHTKMGKI
jgi:hypothetical protein